MNMDLGGNRGSLEASNEASFGHLSREIRREGGMDRGKLLYHVRSDNILLHFPNLFSRTKYSPVLSSRIKY